MPHFTQNSLPLVLRNVSFALAGAAITTLAILRSPTVHLPMRAVLVTGAVLGFWESRRGWLLALLLGGAVVGGYFLGNALGWQPVGSVSQQQFCTFAAPLAALTSGFFGGLMRRQW